MKNLKEKILIQVKDDLAQIETALSNNLDPYLDLVSKVARHILFGGGKRLRPLLMVLSARICGYQGNDDISFSTIFEYLHAATLLHDDLVDEASLRRGRPVAHSIWGNPTAVLVGDFLLARSLTLAAKTNRPNIIGIIAGITENMSQGEIEQLWLKGNLDITEAEYLEVILRKTAVLFQGACRSGAILADAPENEENALSEYGRHLGLAFQMADDLLDYIADTKSLGKAVGADLKEGKLTLPVIYSLKGAIAADREKIRRIIQNSDFSVNEFEMLVKMLYQYGGIDYTRREAVRHVEKAKEAISIFTPSPQRDLLMDIADYSLIRKN
ncbi:MAG: polyprenyl synthetase [Deltaproteobacteria bacterium RBG_13_49_15]|nr:MAG: polyprenyl synthetase [Deltaproteobacteria bacterium RBG_13_49_15]